jgi:hypothetical protein
VAEFLPAPATMSAIGFTTTKAGAMRSSSGSRKVERIISGRVLSTDNRKSQVMLSVLGRTVGPVTVGEIRTPTLRLRAR